MDWQISLQMFETKENMPVALLSAPEVLTEDGGLANGETYDKFRSLLIAHLKNGTGERPMTKRSIERGWLVEESAPSCPR
jgi:hypothetical protein